jgi:hypothetical protein
MIALVNSIRPRDWTNIGMALTDSKTQIDAFIASHPGVQATQIFTTDGNATRGEIDKNKLADMVDTSYDNIFVGYGFRHCAETLQKLSSKKNTKYHFIDDIEAGGIVFGEVMHSIFFKVARNVRFIATEGVIYDFRSNQWTTELAIDFATGESQKTLHLLADSLCSFEVDVVGDAVNNDDEKDVLIGRTYDMPKLLSADGEKEDETETNAALVKNMFRNKSLQLLYRAAHPESTDLTLAQEMSDFLKKMELYLEQNGLSGDTDYVSIKNDIKIGIKTLHTPFQRMYAAARSTSSGAESAYKVTKLPSDSELGFGALGRQNAAINPWSGGGRDLGSGGPVYTSLPVAIEKESPLSKQLTGQQMSMMRQCSAGNRAATQILDEEDEDEDEHDDGYDPKLPVVQPSTAFLNAMFLNDLVNDDATVTDKTK